MHELTGTECQQYPNMHAGYVFQLSNPASIPYGDLELDGIVRI